MRDQQVYDRMLYVMAAVVGAVAFIMIYGINVLNPVYVDWLLGKWLCAGRFFDTGFDRERWAW